MNTFNTNNQCLIDLRMNLDALVAELRAWELVTLDTRLLDAECHDCYVELSDTCTSLAEWDMLKDETTANEVTEQAQDDYDELVQDYGNPHAMSYHNAEEHEANTTAELDAYLDKQLKLQAELTKMTPDSDWIETAHALALVEHEARYNAEMDAHYIADHDANYSYGE